MKSEVKKYSLTIFGDSYILMSDEPEQAILAAASQVDELMHTISLKADGVPLQKLAILAALKTALSLNSLKAEQDEAKISIKRLIESLSSSL